MAPHARLSQWVVKVPADWVVDTVSMIDDGPFARLCIYRAVKRFELDLSRWPRRQTGGGKLGHLLGVSNYRDHFDRWDANSKAD
jgi:hypothetical protein